METWSKFTCYLSDIDKVGLEKIANIHAHPTLEEYVVKHMINDSHAVLVPITA